MKTTNDYNTFIEVADDCPVLAAEIPPHHETPSLARLQFEMLYEKPYVFTSDDVVFAIHAKKQGINAQDMEQEKIAFFSKGQPCFRSSPLAKRYGWGIHSNGEGKLAIYARESVEYAQFIRNAGLAHLRAMRSKRAEK